MKEKVIFENAYLVDIGCADPAQQTRFEEIQQLLINNPVGSENEKEIVKQLLMISIVDEQLAELNYLQSYNLTKTTGKTDFDPEFEKHEEEEREHKYDFIERLRELDSAMIFMPIDQWIHLNSRGVEWQQEMSNNSSEIIKHRLEEEKQAVEFYGLCVDYLRGSTDSTTYTLFKKVKEDEEEHIKDLRDLARDHGFIGINE